MEGAHTKREQQRQQHTLLLHSTHSHPLPPLPLSPPTPPHQVRIIEIEENSGKLAADLAHAKAEEAQWAVLYGAQRTHASDLEKALSTKKLDKGDYLMKHKIGTQASKQAASKHTSTPPLHTSSSTPHPSTSSHPY